MGNHKVVVLVSGGMDSAVLLWSLFEQGRNPLGLSIHYGQRHARELQAARKLCELRGVPHIEVDLGVLRGVLKGSSQTDDIPVPEGHYEDPVMRITVVPNRNMILLSVAAAVAIGRGIPVVAYAAHTGDHACYPDCRPEFVAALREALALCHYDGGIRLFAPFVERGMSKTDLAREGNRLGVPFAETWSCYAPAPTLTGPVHCGKCGTCCERIEAFRLAGVPDPTVYADPIYADPISRP